MVSAKTLSKSSAIFRLWFLNIFCGLEKLGIIIGLLQDSGILWSDCRKLSTKLLLLQVIQFNPEYNWLKSPDKSAVLCTSFSLHVIQGVFMIFKIGLERIQIPIMDFSLLDETWPLWGHSLRFHSFGLYFQDPSKPV